MSEVLIENVPEELQNQYLLFRLDEIYALELSRIVEIMELPPVTTVPETPAYITGIANWKGQVLPILDLRVRFHRAPAGAEVRRCVVVVRFEQTALGLVVDAVEDLLHILPEQLTPPPQVGEDYAHVFVKKIALYEEGKIAMVLDGNTLIHHKDLELLQGIDAEDTSGATRP